MLDDNPENFKSSRFANLVAFLLCCILYYQIVALKQDWVFIDYLNLAYHEAGHLFLCWAGEVLHMLGGTLGQVLFPLSLGIIFFVKRQSFPGLIMIFWVFENFINISRYLADAETMDLPLVGGDIHDWNWLLSHFNRLDFCTEYARKLHALGIAGMSLSLLVALYFLICSFLFREEGDEELPE